MIKDLAPQEKDMFLDDAEFRVEFCKRSFFHFISYYVSETFELDPAIFHKELVNSLDSVDELNKYLAVMGFRGCAKSTILEAFAIWSMINDKHNFIIWIGNTMDDSKMSLANIKSEIESNKELRDDFDIALVDEKKKKSITEKWSEKQLIVKNCTIVAKSRMGKVRGVKFNKDRIDLIICDDLEDIKTTDTKEKRKATLSWFYTEVMQAQKQGTLADNTKVVMLYNLVHPDCLGRNFAKAAGVKSFEFPLIDENGDITWKALYPDMAAIEKKKAEVIMAGEGIGHIIWAREYLLKNIDTDDMVLKLTDIQYYPDEWLQRKAVAAGVGQDFAISKAQTADYTAMCKGIDVKNDEGERRLLIMKDNVEKRMDLEETINKAIEINEIMPQGTRFYPEKVGYQQAIIEMMEKRGLSVVPMQATGDKKARIASACFYVKTGRVLFPKEGAENVIAALVGFGVEDHDDLADAFAYLVLGLVKKGGGILFG